MSGNYYLGIDTSNYKTSVAVVDDEGNVISDCRKFLEVKKGERGIRQSEALFQHVNNLPGVIKEAVAALTADNHVNRTEALNTESETGSFELKKVKRDFNIKAVAVSSRPRPLKGSYMPAFLAGVSVGKSVATAMGIPVYEFSHQEGHVAAVKRGLRLENPERFIAFHFSGGTTEAVMVTNPASREGEDVNRNVTTYEIVGGSRDISYGQLLDRIGVAVGFRFPCGEEMDKIACAEATRGIKIPKIKCKDGYINLSGQEAHCLRRLKENGDLRPENVNGLIFALFEEITSSMSEITEYLAKKYDVRDFIYAGGVSSSSFVRKKLKCDGNCNIHFGEPELATDNAVGTALLGRERYGAETDRCVTTK